MKLTEQTALAIVQGRGTPRRVVLQRRGSRRSGSCGCTLNDSRSHSHLRSLLDTLIIANSSDKNSLQLRISI